MGDPKKRRKQYTTPRKKWDKQLLESERKVVNFYGLKNKKELRKHTTWLRNKRQIARSLLALPLETRMIREKELMSGLRKIDLVKADAILDDVLGLKVEELLEKRLQTAILRKGLANTSKQARQFIVHGHISIKGKRISAPGYLVHIDEISELGWHRKPIKIENEKPKKDLKKEFEESAGKAQTEEKAEEAPAEKPAEEKVEKKEEAPEKTETETKEEPKAEATE
ncbi:MAG: 30S ribosomal protein S4 [Candidatus Diapherotrites archaeon]|uniref:Small ribosomal subunit protein uS4 n=1 Tax=Candidatus Iainarchaeum sp. TaxID=3101447 RepID=A0A2D6LPB4_9ARCH|nr:30S ribosomal protein S4 [Candidatus Diapherotrites archaeon]|tara:strand:+ start:10531 stop:11205 length:675 start_codon:yes stop_codon:yes gene_type:complete